MQLLLSTVAVLVAGTQSSAADPDFAKFQAFVEKYQRIYATPAEAAGRFAIFKENLAKIAGRNEVAQETHGVNKFSDVSAEEFKRWYLGYRKQNSTFAQPQVVPISLGPFASIDWRGKGAVTPVKNQGQCGSCWAFSATEQIESDYFLKFNKLKVLAPQQIVSCDTSDYGCNGGNPVNAYQYVKSAGGQEWSKDYPYTSGTTGRTGVCDFIKKDVAADLTAAYYVSQEASQETNMLQQVQQSPMSVCVDATSWQTYTGGIVTASTCGTQLDHCVQVVGYNAESKYWITRNSWGTDWGNDGYIWVKEGENACGIAEEATIVTGSQPQSSATGAKVKGDFMV